MARILLVDDSAFQRKNIAKLLTSMDHDVITAENGEVGLEKVEAENPDLVVTDVLMPVMDGISFLRAMRTRGLKVPSIVSSADIQESTREECLRLGAKAFLTKPVKAPDLERAISQTLSRSARERV